VHTSQFEPDTKREDWMLDPTSLTVPGLVVGQSEQGGKVAKRPDLGPLRSAEINADSGREVVGNQQETRGGSSTGYQGGGSMVDPTGGQVGDIFSGMGVERKKKVVEKPDPDKVSAP